MEAEIEEKCKEWLAWDKNPDTHYEIQSYYEQKDYEKLGEVLLKRVKFGTAGIRGVMAAGYSCMNELVVIQTGQGLLRYLEVETPLLRVNGIIIGYDCRYNSKRFAELTAAIFVNQGYFVYLFSNVVPTPIIPFAISRWKCAAGIMITASHNPKEDNGYKVYGYNGYQIASPTDHHIQEHILQNLQPWSTSWNTNCLSDTENVRDSLNEITASYIKIMSMGVLDEHKAINLKMGLKMAYSAMHGVGYEYIARLFEAVNLTLVPVEEQRDPDPEFRTVRFPNPEEGKSSLMLSFLTADENDCPIVLANDPDADRLAVAEKDPETDQWRVFNGNEIGALLGWWMLHCHQTDGKEPLSDCYFMSSTVSSKILQTIAKAEGMNFVETLTGFKWMGSKCHELMLHEKKVIFAFEEAIGYMVGDAVLDKDGLNAAAHLGTLASYLYNHNLTLFQQLNEIYKEYGYHISANSYFICHDPELVEKIFERLRNFKSEPKTYPDGILDDKYVITSVRDLTNGYDNSQPDNKARLPVSKTTQMITFLFENGLVATIRTSGTEPKIKYYTELCGAPGQTTEELNEILKEMVDGIVSEFLQPELNGLEAKED